MPWATVFLPSHIIEQMNFSTKVELYTGSGRTSRTSTRLLLGIPYSGLCPADRAGAEPPGRFFVSEFEAGSQNLTLRFHSEDYKLRTGPCRWRCINRRNLGASLPAGPHTHAW